MDELSRAIASVPPGRWAVGVSGGADSVALLFLLRARKDLALHVAHLDHETRGAASGEDAEFVRSLAARLNITCTIQKRSAIEPRIAHLPANLSSRYRRIRLHFFSELVNACGFAGVILAHHTDDQAETIFQRLLRGSGPSGLGGMHTDARIAGVRIIRPLLCIRREMLRSYLRERNIPWREDASNLSDRQQRNRVRRLLGARPQFAAPLVKLGQACSELNDWIRDHAPQLDDSFAAIQLCEMSLPLARQSARRWLAEHGRTKEIAPDSIERLLAMCNDAATAPRQVFPGNLKVHRRRGIISTEPK
jgi:tRNA(Ile)-lysidine synthetase-like protein